MSLASVRKKAVSIGILSSRYESERPVPIISFKQSVREDMDAMRISWGTLECSRRTLMVELMMSEKV